MMFWVGLAETPLGTLCRWHASHPPLPPLRCHPVCPEQMRAAFQAAQTEAQAQIRESLSGMQAGGAQAASAQDEASGDAIGDVDASGRGFTIGR